MSRTKKDAKPTKKWGSITKVGKYLKSVARLRKHSAALKAIDDPKTLKRTAANEWNYF